MGKTPPDADQTADLVEHLQKRRTRRLFVASASLIWIGGPAFNGRVKFDHLRGIDIFRDVAFGMWIVMMIGLLVVLATGGGLTRPRRIREAFNDELTVAHRRTALMAGYWVVFAFLAIVYAVSLLGLADLAELKALAPMMLATGVSIPVFTFVILERRSERHG